MIGNTIQLFLAQASGGQTTSAPGILQFAPFLLLIVVFYFIMIRPQQKKAKEHANLMQTLKSGDKVVTSSGIIGTVVAVKDKSVSLRSADTKLEVLKPAVSEISERANEPS
jgi:preprotein translocase subunit YajC